MIFNTLNIEANLLFIEYAIKKNTRMPFQLGIIRTRSLWPEQNSYPRKLTKQR